jgi:hypothetical protein
MMMYDHPFELESQLSEAPAATPMMTEPTRTMPGGSVFFTSGSTNWLYVLDNMYSIILDLLICIRSTNWIMCIRSTNIQIVVICIGYILPI